MTYVHFIFLLYPLSKDHTSKAYDLRRLSSTGTLNTAIQPRKQVMKIHHNSLDSHDDQ